jgi:hypothetical protein
MRVERVEQLVELLRRLHNKHTHTHTHTPRHNLFMVSQELTARSLLRLLCMSRGTMGRRAGAGPGSCRKSRRKTWCHQNRECAEQGGCRGTASPPATSVLLGDAPRVRGVGDTRTSPRHTSPRHSVALSSVCCCQSHRHRESRSKCSVVVSALVCDVVRFITRSRPRAAQEPPKSRPSCFDPRWKRCHIGINSELPKESVHSIPRG